MESAALTFGGVRAQHPRASYYMAPVHGVPTLAWGRRRLQFLYDFFEEEGESGSGKPLFLEGRQQHVVAASVPIRRPTGGT